jgi:putative SOS response-associated peptidase YedK
VEPFAFAGLWEFARLDGDEILSGTEPNPLLDGIHDRMPVMLLPDDYDRWLNPAMSVDDLRAMLKPYDADLMKAYEVSRAVDGVKNDTPECVEPYAE